MVKSILEAVSVSKTDMTAAALISPIEMKLIRAKKGKVFVCFFPRAIWIHMLDKTLAHMLWPMGA